MTHADRTNLNLLFESKITRMTFWNPTRTKSLLSGLICLLVSSALGCSTFLNRDPFRRLMNDPSVDVPVDDDFVPPNGPDLTQNDSRVRLNTRGLDPRTSPIRQVAHEEPTYVARQVPLPPDNAGGNFTVPSGIAGGTQLPQPPPVQYQPGPYQSAPGFQNAPTISGPSYTQPTAPVQFQQPGLQPGPPVGQFNNNPRRSIGNVTGLGQGIAPGAGTAFPPIGTDPVFSPTIRQADLIINGFPARTGRIMFGAAVNSDAGVTGQITIDERNFDITRFPRSFQDLFGGNAFKGAGQTLRIEAVPGSEFDRYIVNFTNPNLFRSQPISMTLGGFLFDRQFNDWNENRLGARVSFGYRLTPSLSLSLGVSGQNVEISDPRGGALTPPELAEVVGDNSLFSGSVNLRHDTRNSPIQPSGGHYFEASYEQAFGDFDYGRGELEYRKYWQVRERPDGSGKQTISFSTQLGFSGSETPIFENFFAGGFATIRGFDFRGASPIDSASLVELGGRFQWLNSVEYMFPITNDDAFRGVAFCDFGTVEQDIEINSDNFRVAPGVGLRVAIPLLGPAPLAFDWAFPVSEAPNDNTRVFSFYTSLVR